MSNLIILKNKKYRMITFELTEEFCTKARSLGFEKFKAVEMSFPLSRWGDDGSKKKTIEKRSALPSITILALGESEPLPDLILENPKVKVLIESRWLSVKKVRQLGAQQTGEELDQPEGDQIPKRRKQ